jgi:hypothetical protein
MDVFDASGDPFERCGALSRKKGAVELPARRAEVKPIGGASGARQATPLNENSFEATQRNKYEVVYTHFSTKKHR